MMSDVGFEPVSGTFDVAQIAAFLAAMPLAARDPRRPATFVLAWDRDTLTTALARPDGASIGSAILVTVHPHRIGLYYQTAYVEPARRFVRWLRERIAMRVFDDDYGGEVTDDVDDALELLFGRPPGPDDFPIATVLADRFEIREWLCGTPDRGRYRAYDLRDRQAVLVTLGPPQRDDLEVVRRRLTLDVPGIMPVRHIGPLLSGESRYDALVEEEPAGEPWTSGDAVITGLAIAEILAAAHARGQCLAGLRPELVYVDDDDQLRGIAPRCEPFLTRAETRCHGVAPCFEHYYMSPEQLALRPPTPADDVFALAATLAYIDAVEHPFEGEYADNAMAIATGRRRPWRGSDSLGPIIDAALRPAPERIGLDELAARLRALR